MEFNTKKSRLLLFGGSLLLSVNLLAQTTVPLAAKDIASPGSDLNTRSGNKPQSQLGKPASDERLVVDLSDAIRPVTHAASGALYGITESLPRDIDRLVTPLKPRMYVQPARSGEGHQQPIGDALVVSKRLAPTSAEVTIRLPDVNPGWPYRFPGWDDWVAAVSSVIDDKLASGRDNYYGYEIWNEHHETWNAENGNFFSALWKPTYDLIRARDPNEEIIGPSDSHYSRARMEAFLKFCLSNKCLPDIISWHELQGSDNISSHVDDYRALERSLGVAPLPISINEYSHDTRKLEGAPGVSVPFIAKFERKGVDSAAISWWFTDLPGRLGSLLTADNEKGGGWHLYKWYGDMTGEMVRVTPPSESGDGLDGFANVDLSANYASIALGGDFTGTVDVVVNGIPEKFGSEVDVTVEHVTWTDKDKPVTGPIADKEKRYTVNDRSITVPVTIVDPMYAYRVYIAAGKEQRRDGAAGEGPRSEQNTSADL